MKYIVLIVTLVILLVSCAAQEVNAVQDTGVTWKLLIRDGFHFVYLLEDSTRKVTCYAYYSSQDVGISCLPNSVLKGQ